MEGKKPFYLKKKKSEEKLCISLSFSLHLSPIPPPQNIYFTCHKAMPNSQRKLSSIACSFVTMHLLKLAEFYYKKEEKEN